MTVTELQTRSAKAADLRAMQLPDGTFFVESSEGKIAYRVVAGNGDKSCTCGDFSSNVKKDPQFQCKHILAVVHGNGNILRTGSDDTIRPKLDDRFITSIQGKEFVIYSGLLDLAHQKGLRSIQVEVVQYPTKDNGAEAICKAVVESRTGEIFIEWGDANPRNVNPKIAQHVLRMAGTRAKARALRDFTNIGMTCLEELGDIDEIIPEDRSGRAKKPSPAKKVDPGDEKLRQQNSKPAPETQKESPPSPAVPSHDEAREEPRQDQGPKPSTAQLKAIENLARRRNITGDELDDLVQQNFGTGLPNLTATEASNFIRILQQSA